MAVSHVKSNTVADWTGTVTVANSAGQYATIAATDLVRPVDWNSAHNQLYTLSGNTTSGSTASGTNVVWAASGPSISIGGNTSTIIISSPPHASSFKLPIDGGFQTTNFNSTSLSISHCQAFNLPEPGSFSFIRVPVVMTGGVSTSFATTAATLSATCNVCSSWYAQVFSLGTGASSRSLQQVASGSASWVAQAGINVAVNGTVWSQTQALTYFFEGNTSSLSTSTSTSQTRLDWSTLASQTRFTGARFIDIPFATSLTAGPYWFVFGMSTSSSANSTGVSGASTIAPRYTQHYCLTNLNSAIGVMGDANLTASGQLNCAVFSTNAAGTTSAIPLANLSTTASQPSFPFFLLRSA